MDDTAISSCVAEVKRIVADAPDTLSLIDCDTIGELARACLDLLAERDAAREQAQRAEADAATMRGAIEHHLLHCDEQATLRARLATVESERDSAIAENARFADGEREHMETIQVLGDDLAAADRERGRLCAELSTALAERDRLRAEREALRERVGALLAGQELLRGILEVLGDSENDMATAAVYHRIAAFLVAPAPKAPSSEPAPDECLAGTMCVECFAFVPGVGTPLHAKTCSKHMRASMDARAAADEGDGK